MESQAVFQAKTQAQIVSIESPPRETRAVASYNPTFREGFTMLLGGAAVAKDTLKVKVSDLGPQHAS